MGKDGNRAQYITSRALGIVFMGSVWLPLSALPESSVDLAANVQRGDEGNGTYLIVMCGASVVCGKRSGCGARSSVTPT